MSIQSEPLAKPEQTLTDAMPTDTDAQVPIATGSVSWFNLEKQFGFVKLDGGMGDGFLHMSVLKAGGFYSVPRGTRVQVRVEPDRGKHKVIEGAGRRHLDRTAWRATGFDADESRALKAMRPGLGEVCDRGKLA